MAVISVANAAEFYPALSHTTRLWRFGKCLCVLAMKAAALGAVVAVAVSTTAVAQQGNAYGLGQPAAGAHLPAGPSRSAR